MPSPFPGMDPYLERPEWWPGFHNNLAPTIQEQLNRQVLPRYYAELTVYTVFEMVSIGRQPGRFPDVSVAVNRPSAEPAVSAGLALAPAPVQSRVAYLEPMELSRVEIRLAGEDTVVTIVEILSPANKRRGAGADEYQEKRQEILRSSAHLVEIDLLRQGERPPLIEPVPAAPYYVTLSRAETRPLVDVWPVQLRQPLPVVPIPLLRSDPDVALDLGAAVSAVYDRVGYRYRIDYGQPPPPPPLTGDEARWLDQLLTEYRHQASS